MCFWNKHEKKLEPEKQSKEAKEEIEVKTSSKQSYRRRISALPLALISKQMKPATQNVEEETSYEKLLEQLDDELKKLYYSLDTNGDGLIQENEVGQLLEVIHGGIYISLTRQKKKKACASYVQNFCVNPDQKKIKHCVITLEEWNSKSRAVFCANADLHEVTNEERISNLKALITEVGDIVKRITTLSKERNLGKT
eukprot:augustus_masked-scaffold_1-processed-gene-22.13-mRNA-1 protein AED:1.00 eAED:1.00 QI:0/-1/0/0/-1/1/1/0/196